MRFDLLSAFLRREHVVLPKVKKPPAQKTYEHDCNRPNQRDSSESRSTIVEDDDKPCNRSNRLDETTNYSLPCRQIRADVRSCRWDQRNDWSERFAAGLAKDGASLSGRTALAAN